MAIGTWQPANKPSKAFAINEELLKRFIALGNEADKLDLASELTSAELSAGAVLMTLDASAWHFLHDRETASLTSLIRFFTLAEGQLPGWKAGNKSPVIAIVGILKKRQEFSTELRKWIKSNTDNRYLPYGSVI